MHPAAWHPDPLGRHEYRYWDGDNWTDHVADGGQAGLDPLEAALAAEPGNIADPGNVAGDATTPVRTEPGWGEPADAGTRTDTPPGARPWPTANALPPAASAGSNGVAVAAMVIGIISLLIAWFPILGLLGGLGGLVAVILGFLGRKRAQAGAPSGGMALSGIITGVVAMALATLVTILVVTIGADFVREYEAEYEACMTEFDDASYCEDEVGRSFVERWLQ